MKKLKNYLRFKYKFVYILIFLFIIHYKKHKIQKFIKKKPSKKDIYYKEKFPKRDKSFNKAKNFLKKCLKGISMNKIINITKIPIISAIINFHNSKKTLTRAIKSIQNQNIY